MEETQTDDNLDNIPIVDSATELFDAAPYEGKRVKIASIKKIFVTNFYPDGKNYDANSQEKMWKVELETEPIKELDDNGEFTDKVLTYEKDGEQKNITVTARFNLQEKTNESTGKKEIVISKHPKAKLFAFMRKMGAETLNELKGKLVTLTVVPSTIEGDDRVFLRLVT